MYMMKYKYVSGSHYACKGMAIANLPDTKELDMQPSRLKEERNSHHYSQETITLYVVM